MTRLRRRLAVVLLSGFAVAGVLVVVSSVLLAVAASGLGRVGDLLAYGITQVAVGAAGLAEVPGVALVLLPHLAGLALLVCAFPLREPVDSAA